MADPVVPKKSLDPAADAGIPPQIGAALGLGVSTPQDGPRAELDSGTAPTGSLEDLQSRVAPNVAATAALHPESGVVPSDGSAIPIFQRPAETPKPPSMISKIIHGLGDATGLTEKSAPGTTLGQRIGGLAGRVMNAGVLAGGNDAQKESTLNQERIQAEMPLKLASLASLNQYRVGRVGTAETANDIKQQQADIARQKADSTMRLKGYVPDEKNPGTYRNMNEDEILSDHILSRNQDLAKAAILSKQAQMKKDKADADVIMNPNNPTFQQKQKEIDAKLALAKAQFALRQHEVANSDAHLALARYQSLVTTGGDDTGRTLTPQNAPPLMAATPGGQPIPYKSPFAPTSQIRNVQAQAAMAVDGIPGVRSELMDLHDQLGPIAGRWNEFMQGKIGMDNPAFAGLRSDLLMLSSAVALAHARGRLPENLREEFDTKINAPQQTADNLISVLNHIEPWMKRASEMSTPIPGNVKQNGSAGAGDGSQPKATHRYNPVTKRIEPIGGR